MKGISVAVANPIDPVCAEDDRPAVRDLIVEHAEPIAAVKKELQDDPLYEESKHDDLWILRFVLSHKNKTKAAVSAAKSTLAFRREYQLDAKDVRSEAPHKVQEGPVKEYWETRCPGNTLIVTFPDPRRGGVCFIDLGTMVPGASEQLPYATWEFSFIYTSEWTHQWLDYITRTTGRFTKSIRILDLQHVSLKTFRRKDMKYDGQVMDKMEDCYPQLLETIYACNAPSFVHILWTLARKIMPKRVVDKFDLIDPKNNETERTRLYKRISHEKLPVQFGGGNEISPHDW